MTRVTSAALEQLEDLAGCCFHVNRLFFFPLFFQLWF